VFNPDLNFHRRFCFAVDKIDAKGKIRKTYPRDQNTAPAPIATVKPQSAMRHAALETVKNDRWQRLFTSQGD